MYAESYAEYCMLNLHAKWVRGRLCNYICWLYMLIADCWLYILIAISVEGQSVIWKSPEVWARGRLCAQSPRSRRGKQLAAWGLGPCSARKGETAEGPWSHQLSSHTPEFFIFFLFLLLFFSFYFDPITCLPIHLHCTILEGALQLFKMPLASNIDTLVGKKQESLKQSQLRAK